MMTTTNPAHVRADDLRDLDDETFRAVVDADLRRRSHKNLRDIDPAVSRALRSSEFIDRWLSALLVIDKSIEGQLAAKDNEYEGDAAALRSKRIVLDMRLAQSPNDFDLLEEQAFLWAAEESLRARHLQGRTSVLKFKTGLDERILEARSLRVRLLGIDLAPELDEDNERLRNAIADHRETLSSYRAAEPPDRALWRLID